MDTHTFTPKAIAILSASSPFFDHLWPIIIEVADEITQEDVLAHTCAAFRRVALRIIYRRKSDLIRGHYTDPRHLELEILRFPPRFTLDPRCPTPLWYEWSAKGAVFHSLENFHDLCELADVDADTWEPRPGDAKPTWTSRTGDLILTCRELPHDKDPYTHYIGCTGEIEKAMRVQQWFEENISYFSEITSFARGHI